MEKADLDYLILFSSPTCPQCRALKNSLKEVGLEYEEYNDYEDFPDEYEKFDIQHLPTLILMEAKKNHKHEEQKRHVGFMTKDELNEFVKFTSCGRRLK